MQYFVHHGLCVKHTVQKNETGGNLYTYWMGNDCAVQVLPKEWYKTVWYTKSLQPNIGLHHTDAVMFK